MSDGVIGLVGVLVGGSITTGTTFTMEYFKQHKEAYHLAHALRGGIGGILAILETRQHVAIVDNKRKTVRAGDRTPFILKAKRNYIELYSKNVDRIGLLSPALGEKIPTFYTFVNSLLEDVDNNGGRNVE